VLVLDVGLFVGHRGGTRFGLGQRLLEVGVRRLQRLQPLPGFALEVAAS
jgi:hypothetical protein